MAFSFTNWLKSAMNAYDWQKNYSSPVGQIQYQMKYMGDKSKPNTSTKVPYSVPGIDLGNGKTSGASATIAPQYTSPQTSGIQTESSRQPLNLNYTPYTPASRSAPKASSGWLDKLMQIGAKPAYAAESSSLSGLSGGSLNQPSQWQRSLADIQSLIGGQSLKERAGGFLGLAGTLTGNPEMNISERMRGGKVLGSKANLESSDINYTPYTPNPANELSSINPLANKADTIKGAYQADTGLPTTEPPSADYDQEAIMNEVNRIWLEGGYDSAEAAQEDYVRRNEAARKAAVRTRYDAEIAQYQSLIPQYTAQGETGKTNLRTGLADIQQTGGQTKEQNVLKSGETERGLKKNFDINNRNMRNTFTALGTAESSSFGENLANLTQGFASDTSKTKNVLATTNASVDMELLKAERDTKTKIAEIDTDVQNKINYVNQQVGLSEQAKQDAIDQLEADAYGAIVQLQNDYSDKKNGLLMAAYQQANNLKSIKEQGNIDLALANTGASGASDEWNQISTKLQNDLNQGYYDKAQRLQFLSNKYKKYPSLWQQIQEEFAGRPDKGGGESWGYGTTSI